MNDDGLVYHDDGEETYSDQEHNNAKRQSAVATLNKARRDKALHNKKASSNALDKKDEDGKNQSMWDFVQTGSAAAAIPSKPSRAAPKMEYDSLLDTLDDVGTSIANHSSRRRSRETSSSFFMFVCINPVHVNIIPFLTCGLCLNY